MAASSRARQLALQFTAHDCLHMAVVAVRLSESDDEGKTSVPTLLLLVQELKAARWHTLGMYLGMTEDEIREIEQDHPGDTARRRVAMLDKWLKKEENPSWIRVIEALEEMSEVTLAKKIRKKYMASEHRGEMSKPRYRINLVQKLKKKMVSSMAATTCTCSCPCLQTNTDNVYVLNLQKIPCVSQQAQNGSWEEVTAL